MKSCRVAAIVWFQFLAIASVIQVCQGTKEVLLLADLVRAKQISLDTPRFLASNLFGRLEYYRNYGAVDYDETTGYIYMATGGKGKELIERVRLDGTGREVLLLNTPVKGMAVDWIAQNIYWIAEGKIGVISIEDRSPKTLISENMTSPEDIVVEPVEGYIFWTEDHVIEKARLDGTERQVIVDKRFDPTGLSIDAKDKRLYWCDGYDLSIQSVDFNGQNRKITFPENYESNKWGRKISLSVLGDYVYWADKHTDTVERANKITGEDKKVIYNCTTMPVGIVAVDLDLNRPYPGTNRCAVYNGDCNHLYLYRPPPSKLVCAYPDDVEPVCPCALPQTYDFLMETFCKSDTSFVMKVKVNNVLQGSDELQFQFLQSEITYYKSRQYIPNEILQNLRIVIKRDGADCCSETIQSQTWYLLMGNLKGRTMFISYAMSQSKQEYDQAMRSIGNGSHIHFRCALFKLQQFHQYLISADK